MITILSGNSILGSVLVVASSLLVMAGTNFSYPRKDCITILPKPAIPS